MLYEQGRIKEQVVKDVSLGEAYMKAGEKGLAIQSYEKSLRLDPKNLNVVEILGRLKQMK